MNSEKLKIILKQVLFAFVFICVGFSIGKEFSRYSIKERLSPADKKNEVGVKKDSDKTTKVVVYYMHATFRCAACNEIERLAKEVLSNEFADYLKDGSIEFKEVNFQKDETIAKRYKVAAGCVVVAKIADGKDVEYDVLNDVWTLYSDPSKFDEYLGDAIRRFLAK
ncbi:MAG TPA: nitrophenyl compound nitroreductase subunit ArsF family protein [Victivallales bacterium]|nr:nitrophenyl compound nitroreductase subunit ArsF family protein [Victivallales bacterium]